MDKATFTSVNTSDIRANKPESDPVFISNEEHTQFEPKSTTDSLKNPDRQTSYSDCVVDFNDKVVIGFLPDHAHDSFAEWPWWNQECEIDDRYIAVHPINESHFHLGYEDPRITYCVDLEELGKHEDYPPDVTSEDYGAWVVTPCEPIDPVAETRSHIAPHSADHAVQIFLYEDQPNVSHGAYKRPFTLNKIRIVRGTARLCYKKAGDWLAAFPGDTTGWFCHENLTEGFWDLSNTAYDVLEVHVMSATDVNIRIDDVHVQSY